MRKSTILLMVFISIIMAQTPQIINDEKTEDPILIGLSQRSDFEEREYFKEWFNEGFVNYEIDEETLSKISEVDSDITLECFYGYMVWR